MSSRLSLGWSLIPALVVAYACKAEPGSAPDDSAGGTGANTGDHTAAGFSGESGASESDGLAGANASATGSGDTNGGADAGETSSGGASPGAGGEPGAAGEAGAPGAVGNEPQWLDDLPGPPDDGVTVLDFAALHPGQSLFGLFVDANDAITVGGWNSIINNGHRTNGFVAKLDSNLTPVWTTNAQYPNPNTLSGAYGWTTQQLAGNAAGEAFVGGSWQSSGQYPTLPNETSLGGVDAALGAYDASGALGWLHELGSSGDEGFARVCAGADGSVYLFTSVGGQLPGKPAEVRNGPAVVKYDADGNQVYATQYKNYWGPTGLQVSDDTAFDMGVDDAGNVYTSDIDGITKLAPSGEKLWYSRSSSFTSPGAPVIPNIMSIGVSPSGRGLFAFGSESVGADVQQVPLQRWDPGAGRPLWFREPGVRNLTIDPVEGVIWQGHFLETTGLLVSNDSVYLMGRYLNEYQNGATAHPSVTAAFVGRYDFKGEQIWFKQFTVKASASATRGSSFVPAALALRPNGDILLAGNASGWLIVGLKAADGSLE
jgi:hypothetical protein